MKRLSELQLAAMMLSRLPVGNIEQTPKIGNSAWAFPLVGGILGALAAMVMLGILWIGVAASMAAGLALLAMIFLTGGLHEDGLADVADGFGGGRDTARKLEIMRDSQIGSYGGLALVLSLGLRWQGLVVVLILAGPWSAAAALVALATASRAGLATALWLMPVARLDGMGQLAAGTSGKQALVAAMIGVFALVLFFGWTGITVALVLTAIHFGFAELAKRQIGGQTGDVLGAMQQVMEITGWVVLSTMV